ncbi:MAG: hypothetical protein N4A44_00190 [Alphaproteobacteria bacterium]|jgi:hypothetical protein|nr:hypothetical protein [Alphaproteobacteria bacterium]
MDGEKLCILCNKNLAETREHKILAAFIRDLTKEEDTKEVFVHKTKNVFDGVYEDFKFSKNDKGGALKFKDKQLCFKCNNERSQSIDKAFIKFINNAEKISKSFDERQITLVKNNFIPIKNLESLNQVIKYLIKIIICMIDEAKLDIPKELIGDDFFLQDINLNKVKFKIKLLDFITVNEKNTLIPTNGDLLIESGKNIFLKNYRINGVNIYFKYCLDEKIDIKI